MWNTCVAIGGLKECTGPRWKEEEIEARQKDVQCEVTPAEQCKCAVHE